MTNADIKIPSSKEGFEGPWRVKHSWLKLALMYGIEGTWSPNWSLGADRRAVGRASRAPRTRAAVAQRSA